MDRSLSRVLVAATVYAAVAAPQGSALAQSGIAQAAGNPVGTIQHVWRPIRQGGSDVAAIEVRTELLGFPDSLGEHFSLSTPITYASVPGIADRVQDLEVRDATGRVAFRTEDDEPAPGGFPYYRHWHAEDRVTFPVTISYRSLAPTQLLPGPPFGLFSANGAVTGAGSGFLVLPEVEGSFTTQVHWDLSDLAAGSTAATTFGLGDFEFVGSADQARQGWIMAGPIGHYPEGGSETGFSAAWMGTPTWDPQVEMKWTSEMYAYLGQAFAYLDPVPPYRVFIRVGAPGDRGPGGGTALANSFMGGAAGREPGASPEGESSRGTFTHEMVHMWVGGIDAPVGVSSWFSEGGTTYYTRLLSMRGGFISVDEYGRQINSAFQGYYTNVARNLSADSIAKVGFADGNVRHIPYVRSALYFADLDSKIRAHSGGARNLDKVLLEIFQRRERGEPFNHDIWVQTVGKEAGPSARDDFEGIIIEGTRTLVPASDAFGPCFERRPATLTGPDGAVVEGFEWVRVASIPDDACRRPW